MRSASSGEPWALPGHRARYSHDRSVPIPDLTTAGLLPAGIHPATLQEVEVTFGSKTETRGHLYANLCELLQLARSFQMFTSVIIDGSFVTDKTNPSDIDVVLILPALQLKEFMGRSDYLELENERVKERFNIDLFIEPDLDGMARFFQNLKTEDALQRGVSPRHLRGVVEVTL